MDLKSTATDSAGPHLLILWFYHLLDNLHKLCPICTHYMFKYMECANFHQLCTIPNNYIHSPNVDVWAGHSLYYKQAAQGAGQGGNGFITRNTRNGDKNGAKNDKITEL